MKSIHDGFHYAQMMKKNNLYNSKVYNVLWAKALLFLFFFSLATSAFAHSYTITIDYGEEKSSEYVKDSLSQIINNDETAKIYVSAGTTIYNAEEITGNIEIVQNEISKKIDKQKIVLPLSDKIAKSSVEKPKKQEKYKSKVQFRPLPFESNTISSKKTGNTTVVPSTNTRLEISALVVIKYTISFIPRQEKHNSKYMMSFANEISHWQMRIRPPPAV